MGTLDEGMVSKQSEYMRFVTEFTAMSRHSLQAIPTL